MDIRAIELFMAAKAHNEQQRVFCEKCGSRQICVGVNGAVKNWVGYVEDFATADTEFDFDYMYSECECCGWSPDENK